MTRNVSPPDRNDPFRETFLTIKHTPPPQHVPELLRQRLISQVNDGVRRKLTVITAPGGFGKTTLLSHWAFRYPAKIAWLSLEESDNDPGRFLKELIASLQTVNKRIGKEVFLLLQAEKKPVLETVLHKMVDDIGMELQDFVLVIDNFQVLYNEPVFHILAFLLTYLPPQLHLIVSSRRDIPFSLYDLRSNGQLKEIRPPHLAFTMEEATAWLNREMALELSFAEVSAVVEKTRARPGQLKYAAQCIRQYQQSSDFIADFEKVPEESIRTFLADTLLKMTPPETGEFLQQAAILGFLCDSLCQAVTSQPHAGEILHKLAEEGKFILLAEQQGGWYRFDGEVQPFFQEQLLRNRALLPSELHQRAAGWFSLHQLVEAAFQHAIAAENFDLAGEIIEQQARKMLQDGELKTVEGWLKALPETHIATQPMLLICKAWVSVITNQLEEVDAYLTSALDKRFESREPQEIAGHVQAIRDYLARRGTSAGDP